MSQPTSQNELADLTRLVVDLQAQVIRQQRYRWLHPLALFGLISLLAASWLAVGWSTPAQANSTLHGPLVERVFAEVVHALHQEDQKLAAAVLAQEAPIKQRLHTALQEELAKGRTLVSQLGPVKEVHTALVDIHSVMGEISAALQAMPAMGQDMSSMNVAMQQMNGKMGIMAYGVDSTMGRMGRNMPFPW